MPLAVRALLPFFALGLAAGWIAWRRRQRLNGWVAAAGTAVATLLTLLQLLQLRPYERVDVLFFKTFPFGDIALRLDGLSLAFGFVLLLTASLLMISRVFDPADRRDPWLRWLGTTAAALASVLAGNLVLLYAMLQVLTLAWCGALDEADRRQRGLRLSQRVADLGLLVAAGIMVGSVGTSTFSGVPVDALGPVGFALALVPAAVRVAGLARLGAQSRTAVSLEPAVAWAAPAGYITLRVLGLTGGAPPTRLAQALLFAAALCAGLAISAWTLAYPAPPRLLGRLLAIEAALAFAIAAVGSPLTVIASSWCWLLLTPAAGLASLVATRASLARTGLMVALAPVPPGFAFLGLWLASVSLWRSGVPALAAVLWLTALPVALVAASGLGRFRARLTLEAIWGLALLALAAFAPPVMSIMALPAARAVQALPAGLFAAGWFSISAAGATLPMLLSAGLGLAAVALFLWRLPKGVSLRLLSSMRLPQPPAVPIHFGPMPFTALALMAYFLVAALVIAIR